MFGSKDPTCPFFAFFPLADILDAASPDGIVVGFFSRVKQITALYTICKTHVGLLPPELCTEMIQNFFVIVIILVY